MHRPHITKRELRSIATIEANRCKLLLDGGLGVGIACGVFRLIEARDAIMKSYFGLPSLAVFFSSLALGAAQAHDLGSALLKSKAASKSLNPECVQHEATFRLAKK